MLSPGEPAPDVVVTDESGDSVRMSAAWKDRPVAITFVRHFGCPLCREHLTTLRAEYHRFVEAGGDMVVIGMGDAAAVREARQRLELPFRCWADKDQSAYRAYGVRRGSLWSVAGPPMWRVGLRSLLRQGVGRVRQDPYQLPGAFVVDTSGRRICFAHYSRSSADWAANDDLLAAIRNAS